MTHGQPLSSIDEEEEEEEKISISHASKRKRLRNGLSDTENGYLVFVEFAKRTIIVGPRDLSKSLSKSVVYLSFIFTGIVSNFIDTIGR